jgi:hypothetical protein
MARATGAMRIPCGKGVRMAGEEANPVLRSMCASRSNAEQCQCIGPKGASTAATVKGAVKGARHLSQGVMSLQEGAILSPRACPCRSNEAVWFSVVKVSNQLGL